MANKDDGKKDPLRSGDPKRPQPTLDLKAVEIKPGAMGSEAKATDAKPSEAKAGDAKPGETASSKPAEQKLADAKPSATTVPPSASATSTASAAAKPGNGSKSQSTATGDAGSSATAAGKSESAKAASAAPPPARRGSGIGSVLSHLVAGLAGGFLALLGADTVAPQMGLKIGGPSPQVTDALRARLDAVEKTVSSVTSGNDADIAEKLASNAAKLQKLEGLEARVAALSEGQSKLDSETAALAKRVTEAPAGSSTPDPRIDELQQRLALLTKAAEGSQGGASIPQLAALTGKLTDLESTLANQLDSLRKSVSQEIETRVAKAAEASEAAQSGTQRIDRELADVKTEAARTTQRIETLKADNQRFSDTLAAVQSETGKLASEIEATKSDVAQRFKAVASPADVAAAVAPVKEKLSAIESRVEKVVTAEEGRKANAERIVLSLELANLKRAVDRGLGFGDELAQVQKAAGGKLDLSALQKHKTDGVPTLSDLQKNFRHVAHQIIDAASQPADGGVIDRLLAGAKSVVRVRKVSHSPDDDSVEAVVGRMDTALEDGRIRDFVALSEKLPPPARSAASDFMQKIEARYAVDKALGDIQDQLKTSLGSAGVSTVTK